MGYQHLLARLGLIGGVAVPDLDQMGAQRLDRSFVNEALGSENYFVLDGVEDRRSTPR